MEFIKKIDNVERIYSVHYDNEKLKKLLDEIIKKASYKIDGTFTAPHDAKFNNKVFTYGACLPNGDPMYENIKRIYRYTSTGTYSYHNDSVAVEGTKVTPPQLAFIIDGILSNDSDSMYAFLNYLSNEELISIDEKITTANKAVNEIDNFDFDRKIDSLNILKKFYNDKKEKKYFDVKLLKKYYLQARSLFKLQLVSEKYVKHSGKVLLKDYKYSKN